MIKIITYLVSFLGLLTNVLYSEVVFDGSLNADTKGLTLKGDCQIPSKYGIVSGDNLFHSFDKFNILENEKATFTGPSNINNIINRITGGQESFINGTISSDIDGANLFLLNPAGVFFGENASLDISGSIHISTSDHLLMKNGDILNINITTNTSETILSSSDPVAFGFLDNDSKISLNKTFLEVHEGKDISLLSSEIDIINSEIYAPGGKIILSSIKPSGTYINKDNLFENTNDLNRGNVHIVENSSISVYGNSSGEIWIVGGQFFMEDSVLENISEESIIGGTIEINVDKLEFINNAHIECKNLSYVDSNQTTEDKGVNVIINAKESFNFSDNSSINTSASSINGINQNCFAGNVEIYAADVFFSNASQINSGTIRSGKGGNISIHATNNALFYDNSIIESKTDTGDGGDISIKANNIVFVNGSGPGTQTTGKGHGGNISLIASNSLKLYGLDEKGFASTITVYTSDNSDNAGNAGNVDVYANNIWFDDGGKVIAGSFGTGDSGKILINASNSIHIQKGNPFDPVSLGYASGIFSRSKVSGSAGSIQILAQNDIKLSTYGKVSTDAENSDGGKIEISAGNNLILHQGQITTSVKNGEGNGGDIQISGDSVVLNNSQIQANAELNDGGAIFIKANNYFQSNNSIVEATSKRGNEGSVEVYAPKFEISKHLDFTQKKYLNATKWIKTPCSDKSQKDLSQFVLKNVKDSIPISDYEWMSCSPGLTDNSYLHVYLKKNKQFSYIIKLLNRGHFAHAILSLNQELKYLDVQKNPNNYIDLIVYLSYAYQCIGHQYKALEALQSVENQGFQYQKASYFNALSCLYLSMDNLTGAVEALKIAKKISKNTTIASIVATTYNNVGNALFVDGYYSEAHSAYKKALENANETNDSEIKAKVLVNMAKVLYENHLDSEAVAAISQSFTQAKTMPNIYEKAVIMITIGKFAQYALFDKKMLYLSNDALSQAYDIAVDLDNHRLIASSCGYKARLFELMHNFVDAEKLTKKAIFYSQQGSFPELTYLWKWQLGRIMLVNHDIKASIQSYYDAINALESVRNVLFQNYFIHKGSFDNYIKPVYLELVQILLKQAEDIKDVGSYEKKLLQARDIIERKKTTEIEIFFNDECMTDRKLNKFNRSPEEVVLFYPISFPDHLTLLLTFSDSIKVIDVPVTSKMLDTTARQFRIFLQTRTQNQFLIEAKLLYNWLIKPAKTMLDSRDVKTIVIAPDSALRLIPFAALHDGSQFLIENYAIATVPAIRYIDTTPFNRNKIETIVGGLSENRKGFSILPNVPKELMEIKDYVKGDILLLNNDFTINNLRKNFESNKYSIVHFATHGYFGGTRKETFLLTYDSQLTMDDFQHLVSLNPFRNKKLELISLSACQTAIGDDRSGLGLAGVAIKAGAKSAVATLWSINDEAASIVTREFYYRLINSNKTKAKILQEVQKELIALPRFWHPIFWAPFLLIGNWM